MQPYEQKQRQEQQQEQQPLLAEREKTSESAHDAFLRTGFISENTLTARTNAGIAALSARSVRAGIQDRLHAIPIYGSANVSVPTEESRFAHLSGREKKKAQKDLESNRQKAQKLAGSDALVTGDTLDMQRELQAYRKDIAQGKGETGGDETLRNFAKDDSAAFMPKQWSYAMRNAAQKTLQKFSKDWKKGGAARVDLRGLQEDLRDQLAFRDKIREQKIDGSPQFQAEFKHFEECVKQLDALVKICANANGLNEAGAFVTRAEAQTASAEQNEAISQYFKSVNDYDGKAWNEYQLIKETFLAKDETLQKLISDTPGEAGAPFAMKHFARDYGYFKYNMDQVPPGISADNKTALDKTYAEYVSVLKLEEIRLTKAAALLADPGGTLFARHQADQEENNALKNSSLSTIRKECLEKAMLFMAGGRLPDDDLVYQVMEMDLGISADKQRAILQHFVDSRTAGAEEAYLQWQMGVANKELETDQHEIARKRGERILQAASGDAAGLDAVMDYLRERMRLNVFTSVEKTKLSGGYEGSDLPSEIEAMGCKIYGDWRDMMEYSIKKGDTVYLTKNYTMLSSQRKGAARRDAFNEAVPSHAKEASTSTRDVTNFLPLEAEDEEIKQTIDDIKILGSQMAGSSSMAARLKPDTPAQAEARARYAAQYLDYAERVKQDVRDLGVDLNAPVTSPAELATRAFKMYTLFAGLQQTALGFNGRLALGSRTADAVIFCTALKNYVQQLASYGSASLEDRTAAIAGGQWDFAYYTAQEAKRPDYAKARNGAYDGKGEG
jgi:hypothetical protein